MQALASRSHFADVWHAARTHAKCDVPFPGCEHHDESVHNYSMQRPTHTSASSAGELTACQHHQLNAPSALPANT